MTETMTVVYINKLILSIVGLASYSLGFDAHTPEYDCIYDEDLAMGSVSEVRMYRLIESTLLNMNVDYTKELLEEVVSSLVKSGKLEKFSWKRPTERFFYRIVD